MCLCTSVLASNFVIKDDHSVQITKGADIYTFILKDIEDSVIYIDKIYGENIYKEEYKVSDCLIKTERGCHLTIIDAHTSEEIGYVTLKDVDTNEEVVLNINLNQLFSEDYTFDEPNNLFWLVKQHLSTSYNCPEVNTVDNIRNKINEIPIIRDLISNKDIQDFKEQCDNSDFFLINGIEVKEEIKKCFDYLSNLLEQNDLSVDKKVLYKECYIRSYFNERFNEKTIKNYNPSFFKNLFEKRDIEFIEFIKVESEYNNLRLVTIDDEDETGREISNKENLLEKNLTIGKDRKVGNIENAIDGLEEKTASENLIELIKEKIKSFFKWIS